MNQFSNDTAPWPALLHISYSSTYGQGRKKKRNQSWKVMTHTNGKPTQREKRKGEIFFAPNGRFFQSKGRTAKSRTVMVDTTWGYCRYGVGVSVCAHFGSLSANERKRKRLCDLGWEFTHHSSRSGREEDVRFLPVFSSSQLKRDL